MPLRTQSAVRSCISAKVSESSFYSHKLFRIRAGRAIGLNGSAVQSSQDRGIRQTSLPTAQAKRTIIR